MAADYPAQAVRTVRTPTGRVYTARVRIVFASSEVFPFSKTGGLADVAGALPAALAARGHEVLVVTPWYATLRADPPPLWIGDVQVPFDGGFEAAGIGTLEADGVRYAFVGHDDFRHETLYGRPNDARRFARFTRAIPPAAARVGFVPDVVHANDWHTGHLPALLAHGWYLPEGFPGAPSVFTIHNLQHQGVSELAATLHRLRLPGRLRDGGIEHFGSANAMKSALRYATRVTTVSPTYAEEIRTPEFGYGLDGVLRDLGDRLHGILNGLDTRVWDPARDPHLPAPYDADDPAGKVAARDALVRELGLSGDGPILGTVGRLAEQKGVDLLLRAAPRLVQRGWRLALLGSGDPALEDAALGLAAAHPGRVAVRVGYSEPLAHLIYAGADALGVPSRFEPCGLSQLIAMRYGTLPIARATGGLRDTIRHGETGFLFATASADALLDAAAEARAVLGDDGPGGRLRQMRRAAMAGDVGWERSAEAYEALYERIAGGPAGTGRSPGAGTVRRNDPGAERAAAGDEGRGEA